MFKPRTRKEENKNEVRIGNTNVTIKSVTKTDAVVELSGKWQGCKTIMKLRKQQAQKIMGAIADAAPINSDFRVEISGITAKMRDMVHASEKCTYNYYESKKCKVVIVGIGGYCTIYVADENGHHYHSESFSMSQNKENLDMIRYIVNEMAFELI